MLFWQFTISITTVFYNYYCCPILQLKTLRPPKSKYVPKLTRRIEGRVEMQTQLCVAARAVIWVLCYTVCSQGTQRWGPGLALWREGGLKNTSWQHNLLVALSSSRFRWDSSVIFPPRDVCSKVAAGLPLRGGAPPGKEHGPWARTTWAEASPHRLGALDLRRDSVKFR